MFGVGMSGTMGDSAPMGMGPLGMGAYPAAGDDYAPDYSAQAPPSGAMPSKTGTSKRRPAGFVEADNDELAGDLSLRQGRAADAVSAYERALARAFGHKGDLPKEGIKSLIGGTIPDRLSAPARRLAWKLLAAYVQAGQLDTARFFINHLRKGSDLFSDDGARGGPASSASQPSLPGSIVVSATKAQLDAVAAGELSLLLFRQAVEVRVFDPHAPRTGDDGGSGAQAPADLSGKVLSVSDELIEVSLGADDGLRPRMTLHVVHDGSMIATAEVISVARNRAVARVTSRTARSDAPGDGTIHTDDRVVSPVVSPPASGSGRPPAESNDGTSAARR